MAKIDILMLQGSNQLNWPKPTLMVTKFCNYMTQEQADIPILPGRELLQRQAAAHYADLKRNNHLQ